MGVSTSKGGIFETDDAEIFHFAPAYFVSSVAIGKSQMQTKKVAAETIPIPTIHKPPATKARLKTIASAYNSFFNSPFFDFTMP